MGDPPVMFKVGNASLESPKYIDVRSIARQNQRDRGKAGLAVQPRLADGDGGKSVGEVVHGEKGVRSEESEYYKQWAAYIPVGEAILPGHLRSADSWLLTPLFRRQ